MGFFYIIDENGRYLGNINGTKVLFHRANSATFQHRQTREMIEKLKARAESLGASGLTVMEAGSMEEAKEYMVKTYCNGNADSIPKRGRPCSASKAGNKPKKAVSKPKVKKIEFKIEEDEEGEEYVSQFECNAEAELKRTREEEKYLKAIKDPSVKDMFAKCNVNKKCMLCKRLCKQPATSVIYQCPQFEYDEYRDN